MSITESASQFNALFQEEFLMPRLTEWLDWVAGRDPLHFVALPMIQRGAVWKPRQIITLWDSLLRGMPIGSLLLSRLHERDKNDNPIQVRKVGSSLLQDVPQGGGVALIDGQQRTLAILLGWPHSSAEQRQGRTLWVDFADKPGTENLFRMHLTSKAHPYGYTKADPNAKISLSERRKAREVLKRGEQFPWESHFPVRLEVLIQTFLDVDCDVLLWKNTVLLKLRDAKPHREKAWKDYVADPVKWNAMQALDQFALVLQALFKLKLPLFAIPEKCFAQEATQEGDDPALAVLFKRVGTGGTPLSDADYVYSVIKHHLPETFQLVETLVSRKGFAQLLGPIDLVMTAVRLVAAEQGMTDFESPSKANFDNLRKDASFLQGFLALVKSERLSGALHALSEGLKFCPENGSSDPGLPMHGFILVSRPVLQVLLHWLLQSIKGTAAHEAQFAQLVAQSRDEMLRFVLYAHLGLQDKRKASIWAFAWLKDHAANTQGKFPSKAMVAHLIQRSNQENRDVAWPLPTKEVMQAMAISSSVDSDKPLLGFERFSLERFKLRDESQRIAMGIFYQWWGNGGGRYQHQILLWLQRTYVDRIDKNPDEVRSDDEVPYDYDHICPANHWGNWTGINTTDRLIDFLSNRSNRGHFHVGNSIGNVRVWYASHNRGDGDTPAAEKLEFHKNEGATSNTLLIDSAILAAHTELWNACSGQGSGIAWSADRAIAFQKAVECRVYSLYAQYFDDLKFAEWFPIA